MDPALPPGIAAMIAAQQQIDTEPPPPPEALSALEFHEQQPDAAAVSYIDHMAHGATVPVIHQSDQGPLVIRGCFDAGGVLADSQACTSSTLYTTASDCPGIEEAFDNAATHGHGTLGRAGRTGAAGHKAYRKKIVPCTVCDKRFVNEHSLKIHMGIKHKEYKKAAVAPRHGWPAKAQSPHSPYGSGSSVGRIVPVQLERAGGRPNGTRHPVKVPLANESGRFACTWGCDQSFTTRAGAWGHTAHCPLKATVGGGHSPHYCAMRSTATTTTHKGTKRKYSPDDYRATSDSSYVRDNASLHCDLCEYVADGQFQLRQHRWMEHHSKHICMMCNAASPDGQSLADHMRTEHGESNGDDAL